jgi:hypothetical protein
VSTLIIFQYKHTRGSKNGFIILEQHLIDDEDLPQFLTGRREKISLPGTYRFDKEGDH